MIYFLTDKKISNYKNDTVPYTYNSDTRNLELLETCYPFWILYNAGVRDIKLITDYNIPKADDIVIFYNSSSNNIKINPSYRNVQIVTDTPLIEGCDAYVCYDPSIICRDLKHRWFHVMYPMPIGLKRCQPQWPPKVISCVSPKNITLDSGIKKCDYRIVTDSWCNIGDEHIMFHIRQKVTYIPSQGLKSRMRFPSHKTPNRLYQAWYCNVPGIFSSNTAMNFLRKSDLDFLEANSVGELNDCVDRLINDKQLYNDMVNNCHQRQNENTYEHIVSQWHQVFNEL